MPNAFLTGSQVYGTPGPDSDVDLVVRVDQETYERLLQLSGGKLPIRFGKLNLIACASDETYMAWALGKHYCMKEAPVTKQQAITHHENARDHFDVEYGEMVASGPDAAEIAAEARAEVRAWRQPYA